MQGHSTVSQAVPLQTGQVISSHLQHGSNAGSALQWQWPYLVQCLYMPCYFGNEEASTRSQSCAPEDAVALAQMKGSNGASLARSMSAGTAQGVQERGHALSTGSAETCPL